MTVRGAVLALALLAAAGPLAACGTASAPSPPSGVDGLTIPTPSPDPQDFRAGVDQRWFPLAPGNRWTYEVTDATGNHRLAVGTCGEQEVDGVETTRLCAQQGRRRTTDYYAEDRAGNVWWFGSADGWTAGATGPGILLTATPRVGDGYVVGDGTRATVESVDDQVALAGDSYDHVVELSVTSPSGVIAQRLYAPGVGLVQEVSPGRVVRLVSFSGGH